MVDSKKMPLRGLEDPLVDAVAWLIASHHIVPSPGRNGFGDRIADRWKAASDHSWPSLCGWLGIDAGYLKSHSHDLNTKQIAERIAFPHGLPIRSSTWRKAIAETSGELIEQLRQGSAILAANSLGLRPLLVLSRLTLVKADHLFSSQNRSPTWQTDYPPHANTMPEVDDKNLRTGNRTLNQKLDEHLLGVADTAVRFSNRLPHFQFGLPSLAVPRSLRKRSQRPFEWQNKAVDAISQRRSQLDSDGSPDVGTVVMNLAGTGTGKTLANAKIMAALRPDAMRVSFTLGLRTLTLQTGDEYRSRLHLDRSDLEVLIGSSAVQTLHEQEVMDEIANEDSDTFSGSDAFDVPDEEFFFASEFGSACTDPVVRRYFGDRQRITQQDRMIATPFLVCTIDHLMPAVEGVRRGRQLAPLIRVLSADLVIDEIDDYDLCDLPAVLRLVHTAAMLGRNVLVSSATLPPDLAAGVFAAYQTGWNHHAAMTGTASRVDVAVVDEFKSKVFRDANDSEFKKQYDAFVHKKAGKLAVTPARRNAVVIQMPNRDQEEDGDDAEQAYCGLVRDSVLELHRLHRQSAIRSDASISVGLVRVANIPQCVAVSKFLLGCQLPQDTSLRLMTYHSRQVLLLRSEQEAYLDGLLDRRERNPAEDLLIQSHVRDSSAKDVVFVVVATPVAEVGRDHDYDWAVIEPSSLRSIIQVAGRVRRHRQALLTSGFPNIAVLDQNWRSYVRGKEVAFTRPGYENAGFVDGDRAMLNTHCLSELLDCEALRDRIDARPRIVRPATLAPTLNLSDLEHHAVSRITTAESKAAQTIHGWSGGHYYRTDISQQVSPFRRGQLTELVHLRSEDDQLSFHGRRHRGKLQGPHASIAPIGGSSFGDGQRWWRPDVDYLHSIERLAERTGEELETLFERFGTLELPLRDGVAQHHIWHPQLGAYEKKTGRPD